VNQGQGGGGGWDQVYPPQGQPPQQQQYGVQPYGQQQWGTPPQPQPAPYATAKAQGYQPTQEELDYVMWAHLWAGLASILCCLVIPIIPVAAPLLVLTQTKNRGPFLMFHLNQSVIFQVALFVINTIISVVGGVLTIVCIGYLLLPLLFVTWMIGMIYPIVIAFAAKRGEWVEYIWAGRTALNMRSPLFK
jgi:uncharacterized membrane protein